MVNPEIKRKKILFLVTEDWYFVSHRLVLAVGAKKSGYDVVVATRIKEHHDTIEKAGLRVISLNRMERSSLNLYKELRALIEIIGIYAREKPDLVHQVAWKPVIYGSVAAFITRISAKVNALGGLGFAFSSKRKLAMVLRFVFKNVLRLVLNGNDQRLILQNEHDLSILVKNNVVNKDFVTLIKGAGADLEQYEVVKAPSTIPVIMMASRLLADKGVRELVEAARILKGKERVFRCVLVGAPDLANPTTITENEIQTWVEEGVIEWWGQQSNMPHIIAASNVVVLPSYYGEGLPKILIEAAACGRAVITTDHPGCRDAIIPEVTGLLVPCRNEKALADAIELLILNPNKSKAMGDSGRKWAEKALDVKLVIAQHLKIYDELISGNKLKK